MVLILKFCFVGKKVVLPNPLGGFAASIFCAKDFGSLNWNNLWLKIRKSSTEYTLSAM